MLVRTNNTFLVKKSLNHGSSGRTFFPYDLDLRRVNNLSHVPLLDLFVSLLVGQLFLWMTRVNSVDPTPKPFIIEIECRYQPVVMNSELRFRSKILKLVNTPNS